MLTHGYWYDFTVSILKCEEVVKIYRDHPHGLKPYHFISPYHFILHNIPIVKKIFSITDFHLYITYNLSIILYKDDILIIMTKEKHKFNSSVG